MNLPNILTISRIFLTFIFLGLIFQQGALPKVLAFFVFILASVTDYLDGYLAKRNNRVTVFGKIMDPIADKFLILAAFFVFTKMNIMAVWMFIVIFVREVSITALRLLAVRRGRVLAAEMLGKYKTCFQIATIVFILIFVVLGEFIPGTGSSGTQVFWIKAMWASINLLLSVTVGLTLLSGLSFFWNNKGLRDAR